jgi:hypothetical protein
MIVIYGQAVKNENEVYRLTRCQWLMPIILATQEAEIRRITVPIQPRQIVLQDSISKKSSTKKDWWSGSKHRP